MTGPEHYLAAEQLLAVADRHAAEALFATATADCARAQVHATLALAAATALNTGTDGMFGDDLAAWERVCAENVSDVDPETGRDYAEEDDIRRQLAAEQEADDSEALRQEAEDDARADRLIEDDGEFVLDPEHDPATCRECLGACTNCGSLNHRANDCEAEL